MNTFDLLTADRLESPEPDFGAGNQVFNRRFIHQEPSHLMLGNGNGAGNDGGALQALSETVGIRVACRTVVRWYHGGINE